MVSTEPEKMPETVLFRENINFYSGEKVYNFNLRWKNCFSIFSQL
jgi:hypothetical protein